MDSRPSAFTHVVARLRGEVSAARLEAYARASVLVNRTADELARQRREHRAAGLDPWMVPAAARAEQLCGWNAMFLQGVATDLLEADYREEPMTAGYVPPATAQQALRLFARVEAWLARVQQARENPAYRLDVSVPAPLPAWVEPDPLPRSWLPGMLQALRSAAGWAALAMADFPHDAPPDPEKQTPWRRIRQLDASAWSGTRYAEKLVADRPGPDAARRAEAVVRSVLQEFYTLGQLIADPWLARVPLSRRTFPPTVLTCADCGQPFRLPTLAGKRLLATCPRCGHGQSVEF